MRSRMIGAAMIVGLTSGLMGAVAYDQFVKPASADAGPPSGLSTREQNLDTNGLIRVHEQGTPTVSVGNFPATQPVSGTVNVGNLPATQVVSGTVTVGNLPATQNVNIVGGTTTAGIPVVSKTQAAVGNVAPTNSRHFDLSINATSIQTSGCSRYQFNAQVGGGFGLIDMSSGQTLSFNYAIPLTGVEIINSDQLNCNGFAEIFGT